MTMLWWKETIQPQSTSNNYLNVNLSSLPNERNPSRTSGVIIRHHGKQQCR
jgi:hypothetical protein